MNTGRRAEGCSGGEPRFSKQMCILGSEFVTITATVTVTQLQETAYVAFHSSIARVAVAELRF